MEFGLPFGLSERHNEFMQMKRMLIVNWLCLLIAACTSQQSTPVAFSTNTPLPVSTSTPTSAITPTITATDVLMPDGLIMLGPNRYKFLIFPVSFSLPKNWDINNKLHLSPVGTGSSLDSRSDAYIFYYNNRADNNPKSDYPRITMLFETIPSQTDIKMYSEDTLAKGHGVEIVINQTINPKELGINLDSAMAYKSSSIFGDVEYTLYIIHAVYQTTGIEIILASDAESFANFDSDFLFFLKNLSFE